MTGQIQLRTAYAFRELLNSLSAFSKRRVSFGANTNPQFSPSSFFESEAKFFRGQGEVQIVQWIVHMVRWSSNLNFNAASGKISQPLHNIILWKYYFLIQLTVYQ